MGSIRARCSVNPFSRNSQFLGPTLQNFGGIGKTRTKILANLYEIFRINFPPRILLTLLYDASYKREINSLVEFFFLVYEKFDLDFAKNKKIRNSKFRLKDPPDAKYVPFRTAINPFSPLNFSKIFFRECSWMMPGVHGNNHVPARLTVFRTTGG